MRMWCMRFEAKHSYFKKMANTLGNYKNLPKSLASRHQHLVSYQMSNPERFGRYYIADAVKTSEGVYKNSSTYVYHWHALYILYINAAMQMDLKQHKHASIIQLAVGQVGTLFR